MKYVTGGYVGEEEAGQRLFQTIHDPRCKKSGVYWSWNGGPREGRGYEAIEKGGQIVGAGGSGGGWDSIFENDPSDKVTNIILPNYLSSPLSIKHEHSQTTLNSSPLANRPFRPTSSL
eukprot:921843-Amorphochlora_amoeboformis.AAC.2